MIRSAVVFIFLVGISFSAFSQETSRKSTRVNIPGSFLIDIGVNNGLNAPDNFDTGFWGSRTINLYYQYPFRLWETKFSIVPGAGLGMDRYKLTNNFTLNPTPGTDGTYALVNSATLYPGTKKSMIVANYFDVPIELRFDSNPDDISRSFNVAAGVRGGVLLDAFTKIKYKEDGETKTIKDKQNHGLNDIRYGFYTRIGIGGFNLFFQYNTSQLFKVDKGPEKTSMNAFTTGISINGF
ncbi:MAG TPA: outer membrane beta-barrel protein [Cyclobacteriaceae bacterium]|nr:outer membrane beta-barrel protein [Cyclobacteriaceae bacterium]